MLNSLFDLTAVAVPSIDPVPGNTLSTELRGQLLWLNVSFFSL